MERIERLVDAGLSPQVVAEMLLNEDILSGKQAGGTVEADEALVEYRAEVEKLLKDDDA